VALGSRRINVIENPLVPMLLGAIGRLKSQNRTEGTPSCI